MPGVGIQDGVRVPFSKSVVRLGVVLDSKLTWKPQVDSMTKKGNKSLYSLQFIRDYTSKTLRRRLVESLVQTHLDYCTVVYLDSTEEERIRLQRLNNSCVRYIFGVRRDQHIPYRRRLGGSAQIRDGHILKPFHYIKSLGFANLNTEDPSLVNISLRPSKGRCANTYLISTISPPM